MESITRDLEELRQLFLTQAQHHREQLAATAAGGSSRSQQKAASEKTSGTSDVDNGEEPDMAFLKRRPDSLLCDDGSRNAKEGDELAGGGDGADADADRRNAPPCANDGAASSTTAASIAALTAQLAEGAAALEAARAELQAHQRVVRQHTEQSATAAVAHTEMVRRLSEEEAKCQGYEKELALSKQQLGRLGRNLRACEGDVRHVEAQYDAVVASVAVLRKQVTALSRDNAALHAACAAAEARCASLQAVESARDVALARIAGLEKERAAREAEWEGLHGYFAEARERVAEGLSYWSAVREEHAALRTALRIRQAAAAQESGEPSQQRCGLLPSPSPLPPSPPPHRSPSPPSPSEAEASWEGDAASERRLLRCLEAKVVDLALALQQSEKEAALLRRELDTRTAHATAAAATVAALTIAAHGIASESAGDVVYDGLVPQQAAALAASQETVAPLLEQYERLVQLFAEESQHTHQLEERLALAGSIGVDTAGRQQRESGEKRGVRPPQTALTASSSAGAASQRRKTFSYADLKELETYQNRRRR